MGNTWVNDGMIQRYGTSAGQASFTAGASAQAGFYGQKKWEFRFNQSGLPEDLNNDGTNDGFTQDYQYIPAGAVITRALLIPTTNFSGGTNINIGGYHANGTAIDVDGIDVELAVANINTVNPILCDGAFINKVLANDTYVAFTTNGTTTAGAFSLIVDYVLP